MNIAWHSTQLKMEGNGWKRAVKCVYCFFSSSYWNYLLFPVGIRGRWSAFLGRLLFPAKVWCIHYSLIHFHFSRKIHLINWIHFECTFRRWAAHHRIMNSLNKWKTNYSSALRGHCVRIVYERHIKIEKNSLGRSMLKRILCALDAAQSYMYLPPMVWSRIALQLLLFRLLLMWKLSCKCDAHTTLPSIL